MNMSDFTDYGYGSPVQRNNASRPSMDGGWQTDAAGNYTYVGDTGNAYNHNNSFGPNDSYAEPMFSSLNAKLANGNGTANNMGQPQSIFGQLSDGITSNFTGKGIYDYSPQERFQMNQMGVNNQSLDGYKLSAGETAGIQNSMNNLNSSASAADHLKIGSDKDINLMQQNEMLNDQIGAANGFDWGGAINTGLGVANTAMNIGSYFQNQKFNKERLGALKDNRAYAKAAEGRKAASVSGIQSALANA